jgi:hypothetical protein
VRFLALALPAALLILAVAGPIAAALGVGVDTEALAARGVGRPGGLDAGHLVAVLGFEATALTALYLLVEGKTRSRLLDGLLTGFAAWLFRGPLLVVTVGALTRLPTEPFWQAARIDLVALPVAGLAVGLCASFTHGATDAAGATGS